MSSSVERGDKNRIGDNKVDFDFIDSDEFKSKFDNLTDDPKVNQQLRKYAIAMLTHRTGTDGEDIIKNGYTDDVERAYNETVKKLEGYGIKCEKL